MRAGNIKTNPIIQTAPTFKNYFNNLDDQLLKSFWLCSSSAVSLAVVLSTSPAWAEGQFPTGGAPPSNTFPNPTFSDVLKLSDLTYSVPAGEDRSIANPAAAFAEAVFSNNDSAANQTVADAAPYPAPPQPALEESIDTAALTQPAPAEFSVESTDAVLLGPIAQADASDSQPLEPSSEPQPAESTSEPQSQPTAASSQGWQFSVEPYFFVPLDVHADVTVSGRSTSLDLGLDDILHLNRAFDAGLRLQGQTGRWGVILDGFYLYAEDSGSLGKTFSSGSIFQFAQRTSPGRLTEFVQQFEPQQLQQFVQIGRQIGLNTPVRVSADGTVSVRQITVDAAVSYRALDTSLSRSEEEANFYPRLVVAPILGVRTNFLRQTVEVENVRINDRTIPEGALPSLDRDFRFSKTLVDPLVGAQIDLALSERWALGVRGDVSGFNIGATQNLTWNLLLGAQYNITRDIGLKLAYRFNSFDFETGEGLRQTELNLRQNGLMLYAVFQF